MNSFDFLTFPPQNFIFQRKSNKTNFGGVFSLIYLLIFLTIAGFYLVSYYNQDDYLVQYLYQEKILLNPQIKEMTNSDRYNPYFNFSYELKFDGEKEIEDRLKIIDNIHIAQREINKSQSHKIKLQELDWLIGYDCLKENKTECRIDSKKINSRNLILTLSYNGFILDHQNKTSPLYRKNDEAISHRLSLNYDLYEPSRRFLRWNLIRYKEQKGFFSMFENEEDNDYIGLGIKAYDYSEMTSNDGSKNIFIYSVDEKFYFHQLRVLGRIVFNVDFNHCDEYKRIPKSFLDTLANIFSLSMTLLNGLSYTLVNYFSNNFDNYKIMEKIIYNNDFNLEKKEKKKKEINKSNEIVMDKTNDDKNILIINDEIDNEEEQDVLNEDFNDVNENIPKLNCFDFLFSGIYNGKICKLNVKQLLQKSNEIISKYYSIENIIYNQIKLENILKDYRWNNPGLNNFDNNDLIIQFKNLISSFNNN